MSKQSLIQRLKPINPLLRRRQLPRRRLPRRQLPRRQLPRRRLPRRQLPRRRKPSPGFISGRDKFIDKLIGYALYVDECSKYRVFHGIIKKSDLAPRILTKKREYHLSAAGEQNQNATAKRHGGIIDSLTRLNLYQSKLPDPFWFHAAMYSSITLNLLPSKGTADFGKSCFEIFTGKAASLANLRAFGQVCWIPQRRTVSTVNLSKSALVNVKTIFIGYTPNYSAGKFLEPITMKTFNIPLHRVVKVSEFYPGLDNRRQDFSINLRLQSQKIGKDAVIPSLQPIAKILPGIDLDLATETLPKRKAPLPIHSYIKATRRFTETRSARISTRWKPPFVDH